MGRHKVLAHQRHNRKVFEDVPRWQLLGGKTRVRFQACLHDQGQLHLLLRSACCEEGHWHHRREGPRDPLGPAQEQCWPVFLQRLGGLQRPARAAVPDTAEYGKFFRKDKKDYYINTPLFYEAWKLLKADGRWAAMSWTVKVDAPTVFMPDHLRTILATKRDDSTGVYFQNCKEVLEGFFGNLEVVSAEGFKRFLEQMDTSYTSGCWRQETEVCKKVGSTALGERTSSCRGPWTMPKSPRLATSNHGSNALAPLPASSTVRSWSERGGCIFLAQERSGQAKFPVSRPCLIR